MKHEKASYAIHLRFVILSNVSFVRKFDAIYESVRKKINLALPLYSATKAFSNINGLIFMIT